MPRKAEKPVPRSCRKPNKNTVSKSFLFDLTSNGKLFHSLIRAVVFDRRTVCILCSTRVQHSHRYDIIIL